MIANPSHRLRVDGRIVELVTLVHPRSVVESSTSWAFTPRSFYVVDFWLGVVNPVHSVAVLAPFAHCRRSGRCLGRYGRSRPQPSASVPEPVWGQSC